MMIHIVQWARLIKFFVAISEWMKYYLRNNSTLAKSSQSMENLNNIVKFLYKSANIPIQVIANFSSTIPKVLH